MAGKLLLCLHAIVHNAQHGRVLDIGYILHNMISYKKSTNGVKL